MQLVVKEVWLSACNPNDGKTETGVPETNCLVRLAEPLSSGLVRDSDSICKVERNQGRHSMLTSGLHMHEHNCTPMHVNT